MQIRVEKMTKFILKIMVTMLEVSFPNLIKKIMSLVFCSNCHLRHNKDTKHKLCGLWPHMVYQWCEGGENVPLTLPL